MIRISRSTAVVHAMLGVAVSVLAGAPARAWADPPSKPDPSAAASGSTRAANGAGTDASDPVRAQGTSPTAPLALKQDMIRDRLDRFRDAIFRLQQDLSSQEPENAARLARALTRMGETGAPERVAALVDRLNKGESIQDVVASQDQTVADLEVVLAVLVRREGDNDERRQQIEQLQENLKSVNNLLDRQKEVRAQTAAQARGQRLREQLEQAARRASDLLQQQQDMTRATAEANRQPSGMKDDQRYDQAQAQSDLARQTRELSEQLDALLGKAPNDAAPTSPSDFAPGAGATPPAAVPNAPTQPGAPNAESQTESAQTPPSDAGAALPSAQHAAPQASQGTPQPSQNAPPSTPQPTGAETGQQAAQDVQNASQRMSDAASSMHAREDADAEQQQKQAEDNLRRAIHRLEEAARKTQDQSPEQTAKAQHALAEEAQRLSDGMSPSSEKGSPDADDAQSPSAGRQQSQPGADPVQKAERDMWDSAQKLEREQREQSLPSQDEAVKSLEEAKRQMEDALTQKRKEEREEILRDLESRFHDMYIKQKRLGEDTKALDAIGPANFARAEQLQAAQLADGESKLADAADTCLHILEEEGTTIVFPRILEQVGVDLKLVAQRLAAVQTGALTQSMQQEIVEALEQLIEAVQRMQRENEQQQDQQQDSSPNDMNSPLLPTSAELKLLRAAQARVHERTTIIDQARATESNAADALRKTIESTATRQKECADIAAELRKRVEGE